MDKFYFLLFFIKKFYRFKDRGIHILYALDNLLIEELTVATLDRCLIWPLQENYTLSHVRCIFYVLKAATKQAKKLRLKQRKHRKFSKN